MNQHEILKKYIEGVSQGYSNSLIVVSPAGYGKTELTLKTINEMGLTDGVNYRYISNYLTPLSLFQVLADINDLKAPKLLILDDIESTLQDKKIVGLLKSALWETPNGQRKVCWLSNTHRIETQEFNFTGKIIFLLNELNRKSALIRALKDRGLFFEMSLTIQDMFGLMRERAEVPYHSISLDKRREIVSFLQTKVDNKNPNVSLRLLPKAYNLFLLSPHHWQNLVLELL